MRNWKTIVLIAGYLIAMAILYAALDCEVIGRDPYMGGIIVGSATFMVVNRTWLLTSPRTE